MDWNQIMDVKIRSYQYHSKMSQLIQSFINQKRNSGYPYNSSAQILSCFDKMLVNNFPEATTITPEIINAWVNYKPNEHQNSLLRRISPIRQLSKYISGLGIDCFVVPGHILQKQIKYEAHIYTKEEYL